MDSLECSGFGGGFFAGFFRAIFLGKKKSFSKKTTVSTSKPLETLSSLFTSSAKTLRKRWIFVEQKSARIFKSQNANLPQLHLFHAFTKDQQGKVRDIAKLTPPFLLNDSFQKKTRNLKCLFNRPHIFAEICSEIRPEIFGASSSAGTETMSYPQISHQIFQYQNISEFQGRINHELRVAICVRVHDREVQTVNWSLSASKIATVFSVSQFALHGLRALEISQSNFTKKIHNVTSAGDVAGMADQQGCESFLKDQGLCSDRTV